MEPLLQGLQHTEHIIECKRGLGYERVPVSHLLKINIPDSGTETPRLSAIMAGYDRFVL
jgi:hypothetical protein